MPSSHRRPMVRSEVPIGHGEDRYIDDRPSLLRHVCHGDPDRCFRYKGRPMPICARCLGFYGALAIGTPCGALVAYLGMDPSLVLGAFMVATAPLVLDGATQYLGWRRSTNGIRLVTGLLAGFGGGMGATFLLCMTTGVL